MLRASWALIAFGVFFSGLAADPAYADVRRVQNMTNVSHVEISGHVSVAIAAGEQAEATLDGTPAELDRLGVRYRDGRLRIWDKCSLFCGRRDLVATVRIVSPRIDSIEVSKGAEVTAATVHGTPLALAVSMGGQLSISGGCDRLEADVSMGGVLSAENLACRTAAVEASMGGVAEVQATDTVAAEASMGGTITIHGNPELSSRTSMGGVIAQKD